MSGRLKHPAFLSKFRAGDREALSIVYAANAESVAEVIRRGASVPTSSGPRYVPGLSSPHEQHCALQEVFRRAFEPAAREKVTAETKYGPYLRAIACHFLINRAQRLREHVGVEALELDSPLVEAAADTIGGLLHAERATVPEQRMNAHQLALAIRRFLEDVGAIERRVTELRFLEGVSQRDAAEALGMSRGGLRRIEDRVRPALTKWLESHGFEHAEVFD